MKNLEKHVNLLKGHVEHHLHSNAAITTSTVGWQIDHSLRVINSVVSVLQKSSIADFNRNFNCCYCSDDCAVDSIWSFLMKRKGEMQNLKSFGY